MSLAQTDVFGEASESPNQTAALARILRSITSAGFIGR